MALAIEAILALWVWRRTAEAPRHRIACWIALGIAACFVASHLVHFWAEAHYYVPVTSVHALPAAYFPLKDSRSWPGSASSIRPARAAQSRGRPRPAPGGELHYPLRAPPLRAAPAPPNVLLVVVDAMRADSLPPPSLPDGRVLAERAMRFDGHVSGGNSSRAGMFSIFYGLPATLLGHLRRLPPATRDHGSLPTYGYQFGLFSSSPVVQLRWSGSTAPLSPACPTCARRRARPIRVERPGPDPDRRVVRWLEAGPVASLLRLPLLRRRRRQSSHPRPARAFPSRGRPRSRRGVYARYQYQCPLRGLRWWAGSSTT